MYELLSNYAREGHPHGTVLQTEDECWHHGLGAGQPEVP